MPKVLLILFLSTLLLSSYAQKPSFTFSDTYPTNNVDSLENWIKTHPQPTEERLKNLIRLKRTYFYIYTERYSRYTVEIRQLSQRLDHPVGKALSLYGSSTDFKAHLQVLHAFEVMKDTSGMIYALSRLARSNYGDTMLDKGDKFAAEDYLFKAKQLLKARFNAHDFFQLVNSEFTSQAGKPESDNEAILQSLYKALRLCESHPQYQYMWRTLKGDIAITHYYRQDHAASYVVIKEILTRLKPDQPYMIMMYTLNLANECEFLGRYDERLALCQKIAGQIRVYSKNTHPYDYLNLYISFKEETDRRGRYREASSYGDSIVMMQDTIYNMERKQKLIEFQAENKQKQIAELTLQKAQTQNRNRFILTLLGIAVVAALVFGLLGMRLRRANARLQHLTQVRDQFFGIVAHDLRRPMFAFQNIKALVSFHLRKQNYAAIETLSVALDESGVRLQKMLDNLVAWAMSQQETLPYQPDNLRIRERVQAIVDLYAGVNLLKNVRFVVDIPEMLTVYADPNAFDLVVRNLIDNSFKALSNKGHLQITARLSENQQVLLVFEDNAGGMSAEVLATVQSVFDAPERAQIGEKNMGMGLIMVGRFVKRNRGCINVESVAGQGTTFRILLPLE